MKVTKFQLTVLAVALATISDHSVAAYQYQTSYFAPTIYQSGSLSGQQTQFLKQGNNTRWTDSSIQSFIYNNDYSYNFGNYTYSNSWAQTANYDRNLQENIEVSRQLSNGSSYSGSNTFPISGPTNVSGTLTLGDVARKIDGSQITANDVREWTTIDSNGVPTKQYYVVLGTDQSGNEIREQVSYTPASTQSNQTNLTNSFTSSYDTKETVNPEGSAVLYNKTSTNSSNNTTAVAGSSISEHFNYTSSNQTTLFNRNNPNGLDYQSVYSSSTDSLTAYERDPAIWGAIQLVNGKPVINQIQHNKSSSTSTTNLYQAGQGKVSEYIIQNTNSSSNTDSSGQVLASSTGHNNSTSTIYTQGQTLANTYTSDTASTSTQKNAAVSVDFGTNTYYYYNPYYGGYPTAILAPTPIYPGNTPTVMMSNLTTDTKSTADSAAYQAGSDKAYSYNSSDSQHTSASYADGQTAVNNIDRQSSQTHYNKGMNSKYDESVYSQTTEVARKTYQQDEDGGYLLQNGQPVESGYLSNKITTNTASNNYQLGQERKYDRTTTASTIANTTDSLKGTTLQEQGQSTQTYITYRKNQAQGKSTESTYAGQYSEKNSSATQIQNRAESATNSAITYNTQSNLLSTDQNAYTDSRQVTQNGQVTSNYNYSANSSETAYRNDAGAKNEVNGTFTDTRSLLAKNELDYEATNSTQENLTTVNTAGQQTSASLARNNSVKQYADGRGAVSNGGKSVQTDATGLSTQVEDNVVTYTNQFGNLKDTTQTHKVTATQNGSVVGSQTQTRTDSVSGIQLTAQSVGSVVTKSAIAPVQSTTITAAGIETTGTVSATGLNLNGGTIQNMQAGTADTDGTNVKQLRDANTATLSAANAYADARSDQLAQRLNHVEKSAYSGIAISLAAQQSVPNLKPGNVAVYGGMGQFKSASAGAVGVTSLMNDGRTSISAAFGVADSAVGGRVGVSYVFGN